MSARAGIAGRNSEDGVDATDTTTGLDEDKSSVAGSLTISEKSVAEVNGKRSPKEKLSGLKKLLSMLLLKPSLDVTEAEELEKTDTAERP